MSCHISIGIAGWSYPDWKGIVYNEPGMDELDYVSRFVDCIEINSTFYRPPARRTALSWLERTADREGFFFTAKLHRDFTHKGLIDADMVKSFHEGFAPLLDEGRLRSILAQFRYDFDDTIENRRLLAMITKSFCNAFQIVVELRHKSWQDNDALRFLSELGVSVCNLDYPVGSNSFNLQHCTVGANGYFRMHGRNCETWFTKSSRDATYDYYYSRDELEQIKSRLDKLASAFKSLTVIANNHYRGAELANAIELKCMLTGRKLPVPAGLLKQYPSLAGIASNA